MLRLKAPQLHVFLLPLPVTMRDIFWTIVVIWLVYKLADIFRNSYSTKKENPQSGSAPDATHSYQQKQQPASGNTRAADREGEYVDFEEVK